MGFRVLGVGFTLLSLPRELLPGAHAAGSASAPQPCGSAVGIALNSKP